VALKRVREDCLANFPSRRLSLSILAKCGLAVFFMVGCLAHGQSYWNRELRVEGLPKWTAPSHALRDVLLTSLEMLIQDKSVCCGKDSALEDSIEKSEFAVSERSCFETARQAFVKRRAADPSDGRILRTGRNLLRRNHRNTGGQTGIPIAVEFSLVCMLRSHL
jgi:hypothetical protein